MDNLPGDLAEMLMHLNAERMGRGCLPLIPNAALTIAAHEHALDMSVRNYTDHISPEGRSPVDRVAATGYPFWCVGENIAYGSPTAARAFECLMGSEGHRENMLNCVFLEVGLAHVGMRWVQVFATRRES
jgi:uncharacterized protein YkwD